MNDLEQAIAYHERKVKALKSAMPCDGCPIDECSEEHRQLAEWLKKLQAYEEAREEIIRKRDSGQWSEAVVFGFNHAIYIIDKHLNEVKADE